MINLGLKYLKQATETATVIKIKFKRQTSTQKVLQHLTPLGIYRLRAKRDHYTPIRKTKTDMDNTKC